MLTWLAELSPYFSPLNIFRYITFRTGGATATGLLIVFLFGPWMISLLRLRQGKGQPIREDGPQSHLLTKRGTPTMGGLMILAGVLISTLLWANLENHYVWIVLFVTVGFMAASTLLFALTSSALRARPPTARSMSIDLAAGAIVSLLLFIVFTRGLGVSLPGPRL